jgi:3-oxoacyl-[acyl-carrier-protein] synthase II
VNAVNRPPLTEKPRYRVLIAGFGLVTPLGGSAWQTFSTLLQGKTLAQRAGNLPRDIAPVDLVKVVGSVTSAQHTATDPAIELAERAAREAAMAAGIQTPGLPAFVGTSKGAVHALTAAYRSKLTNPPSPALHAPPPPDADLAAALGPHGYLSHHLQLRLRLGLIHHHVAACASSLTALHHARLSLLSDTHSPSSDTRYPTPDTPHHALVITAEASLLPLFIHSYRKLGVLAPQTLDAYRERPLDHARQGFVLGEAGAAVLLKRVPIEDEPMPGETELLDTATAAEAYDLIRPSPTMPALRRIAEQLFTDRTIDVIHPHAPGTADHDPAELSVYADVLKRSGQSTMPHLYACKGALGHTLGAAGLTALVLACLCAKARQHPPMPWLTAPIDSPLPLSTQPSDLSPSTTHAIFASGFAGHTAGTVVRHY